MSRRMSLAFLAVLLPASALCHHTLTGIYERSRDTVLHGTVTAFEFVNPHPRLVIEVRNDDGVLETWRLEMDNRFELERIGITRETFRAGEEVVVKGSVGRLEPKTFYLWRLDRPADGFWYEQRGSTPYIGIGDR
ncbi:MAG: DUF6152 family protein [Gammaproteobacteria bacterium]|nr:DUF6152 family protein [Gammaproteobacteria bacterium]